MILNAEIPLACPKISVCKLKHMSQQRDGETIKIMLKISLNSSVSSIEQFTGFEYYATFMLKLWLLKVGMTGAKIQFFSTRICLLEVSWIRNDGLCSFCMLCFRDCLSIFLLMQNLMCILHSTIHTHWMNE